MTFSGPAACRSRTFRDAFPPCGGGGDLRDIGVISRTGCGLRWRAPPAVRRLLRATATAKSSRHNPPGLPRDGRPEGVHSAFGTPANPPRRSRASGKKHAVFSLNLPGKRTNRETPGPHTERRGTSPASPQNHAHKVGWDRRQGVRIWCSGTTPRARAQDCLFASKTLDTHPEAYLAVLSPSNVRNRRISMGRSASWPCADAVLGNRACAPLGGCAPRRAARSAGRVGQSAGCDAEAAAVVCADGCSGYGSSRC